MFRRRKHLHGSSAKASASFSSPPVASPKDASADDEAPEPNTPRPPSQHTHDPIGNIVQADEAVSSALSKRKSHAKAYRKRYTGLSFTSASTSTQNQDEAVLPHSTVGAQNPISSKFTRAASATLSSDTLSSNLLTSTAGLDPSCKPVPPVEGKPGKQKVIVSALIREISTDLLPSDAVHKRKHKPTLRKLPSKSSPRDTTSDLDAKVDELLDGPSAYSGNTFQISPMLMEEQGVNKEKVRALHAQLERSMRRNGSQFKNKRLVSRSAIVKK